ncbi:hypothetical protein DPMN_000826 [Dreissena polymorpha]|uniref:Uncharacterized protein n=1 Tax=Dreissena polymorpha TaxID=45954 RepID=A0A9D4RS75_DREPO|nr:hypothetical protein DPMN_000826 [Dreissena polymorpha]
MPDKPLKQKYTSGKLTNRSGEDKCWEKNKTNNSISPAQNKFRKAFSEVKKSNQPTRNKRISRSAAARRNERVSMRRQVTFRREASHLSAKACRDTRHDAESMRIMK